MYSFYDKKNKIIYITDPEILAIPIIESNESMIDLKNQSEILFGHEPPECDLTKNDYTRIRQSVYEKISAAQKMLPNNYRFKVYEGFRSITVQKILFDEVYQNALKRMPHADSKTLFHETTRLASPVINFDGTLNIPAHNTGGAIDIELIDQNGDFVDMGMTAKDWNKVDPELCMTFCNAISVQAQENRKLLLHVMESHGFINYPFAILCGFFSDYIGQSRMIVLSALIMIVVIFPVMTLFKSSHLFLWYIAATLLAFIVAMVDGPIAVFLVDHFPTNVRYSGVSLSYNLGAALIGGLSPAILVLLQNHMTLFSPFNLYMIAASLVLLLIMKML